MTNFFTHQEKAKTRTSVLVLYFFLSIAAIVGLIYLGVAGLVHQGERWWNDVLFLWVFAAVLGVMLIGVAVKFWELSKGGPAIAQMLRGRLVQRATLKPEEQRLINVVDEMAIASGVPVPEVYILDHEASINAFAAGYTMNDAVIGVTAGCVNTLTREELQGVIAHEFSHILNGDMSMNLRLCGWINGLVGIAVVGRCLIEVGAEGAGCADEGGCLLVIPLFLLSLLLIGLGYLGVLFGRLIQAAISRQREFLADASAVQFTRNPEGLAGALKKIAAGDSWLKSAHAEEASHFMFGDGIKGRWFDSFSTHPPIPERLKQLNAVDIEELPAPPAPSSPAPDSPVSGLAAASPSIPTSPAPVQAEAVLPQLGALDDAHVSYAHGLLGNIPGDLHAAAAELLPAKALVYAIALAPDEATRKKQFALLGEGESAAALFEVHKLHPRTVELDNHLRLPLVELAIPTLHQLSPEQFEQFHQMLNRLAGADNQTDLFEFALEKMVIHQLEPHFLTTAKPTVRYNTLDPVDKECRLLLSALAHLSQRGEEQMKQAFNAGANKLQMGTILSPLPLAECGLDTIETALTRLAETGIPARQKLVKACLAAITADGVIETGEAELFRAICASIDVPCPPLM